MSSPIVEDLWVKFHHLLPQHGKQTLDMIVEESGKNTKAWLLRAEKEANRYLAEGGQHSPEATLLSLGYIVGCINGALNGTPCPKDEK